MHKLYVSPIGKVNVNNEGMSIKLEAKYIPAMKALDGFSHIQVIWWFSDFDEESLRDTLEAPQPYKTAPAEMGIFATRSPIRPNPIALSAAEVIEIDYAKGNIKVAYIDANDGSPVLDIKPYTPSLDRVESPGVPEWCCHWPMSLEQSGNFNWDDEFNF